MKTITLTARPERLRSSHNGNPRWQVTSDAGVWTTKTDAGYVYGLDWYAMRPGDRLRVDIEAGRLAYAEEVTE